MPRTKDPTSHLPHKEPKDLTEAVENAEAHIAYHAKLNKQAENIGDAFAPPSQEIYITQCFAGSESNVEIHWLVARGGDLASADKCVVKSNEKAGADFYFCLAKLRDYVAEILHLPSDYTGSTITSGIKLVWSSPNDKKPLEKIWSASVFVEKHVPFCDGAWEFWTPIKPSRAQRVDDQDRFSFPAAASTLVERLCIAAEKYIHGERMQINLGEQE